MISTSPEPIKTEKHVLTTPFCHHSIADAADLVAVPTSFHTITTNQTPIQTAHKLQLAPSLSPSKTPKPPPTSPIHPSNPQHQEEILAAAQILMHLHEEDALLTKQLQGTKTEHPASDADVDSNTNSDTDSDRTISDSTTRVSQEGTPVQHPFYSPPHPPPHHPPPPHAALYTKRKGSFPQHKH